VHMSRRCGDTEMLNGVCVLPRGGLRRKHTTPPS
jgi:hypothetical protein